MVRLLLRRHLSDIYARRLLKPFDFADCAAAQDRTPNAWRPIEVSVEEGDGRDERERRYFGSCTSRATFAGFPSPMKTRQQSREGTGSSHAKLEKVISLERLRCETAGLHRPIGLGIPSRKNG